MTPLLDDLGHPVVLPVRVRRVVSLVPSLSEALAATVPHLLVGVTDWCTHLDGLADPASVARVRGTKNPDRRAIEALAPDVVIVNREENRALDVERLRAAGLAVWTTVIESVPQSLTSMRRLFTEVLDVDVPPWLRRAELAWHPPFEGTRRAVAVPIWRDPWMVVGARTFTGDLLDRLGLDNVFGAGTQRYPAVTPEQIVARSPQLVVLPDEPYAFTAADGPEAFAGLRTALVPGRLLTWYGPSLVTARDELTRALA